VVYMSFDGQSSQNIPLIAGEWVDGMLFGEDDASSGSSGTGSFEGLGVEGIALQIGHEQLIIGLAQEHLRRDIRSLVLHYHHMFVLHTMLRMEELETDVVQRLGVYGSCDQNVRHLSTLLKCVPHIHRLLIYLSVHPRTHQVVEVVGLFGEENEGGDNEDDDENAAAFSYWQDVAVADCGDSDHDEVDCVMKW
jgi:hypothetical protein